MPQIFIRFKWWWIAGAAFVVAAAVLLIVLLAGRAAKPTIRTVAASSEAFSQAAAVREPNAQNYASAAKAGLRAVVITTGANGDFPGTAAKNAAAQKAAIDTIVQNLAAMKMNAAVLDITPGDGALFRSGMLPWSASLTGTAGKDPGYDPLAYLITAAHGKGIAVEAAIDPFTVPSGSSLAAQHAGWLMKTAAGERLNPGVPEAAEAAQALIVQMARDYNVDGVVLEGGVYPDGSFDDTSAFAQYGAGLTAPQYRQVCADSFISTLHASLKKQKPALSLGLAPARSWTSEAVSPASDTAAKYAARYAGQQRAVQKQWVDFVCPQDTGALGGDGVSFEAAASFWTGAARGTNVAVYLTQAVFKTGAAEGDWAAYDQIGRQLQYMKKTAALRGSVFAGYGKLAANADLMRDILTKFYAGTLDATFGDPLLLTAPKNGTVTAQNSVAVAGACDDNYPLLLNGRAVACKNGAFSATVALKAGKNTVTVFNKGLTRNVTVQNTIPVIKSVSPTQDVTGSGGTQVRIQALAHIGASVSAAVGGSRVAMTATAASGNDSDREQAGYIAYTGTFTLPASKAAVQDLGKIRVTGSWGGFTDTLAGGDIKVAAGGSGFGFYKTTIGVITDYKEPYEETYQYNDDLYRPVTYPQLPNAWDYVETDAAGNPRVYVCGSDRFYRFSNGEMVETDHVIIKRHAAPDNTIGSVGVSSYDSGRYTRFSFGFSQKITYNAGTDQVFPGTNGPGVRNYSISSFSATLFRITFYNTDNAPSIGSFDSPIVSSVESRSLGDGRVQYTFHLKHANIFYGTYIRYEGNNLVIDFKNPWDGDYKTLRIAIDPGHGGVDPGATGAGPLNEKEVTLRYGLMLRDKLIALGVPASNIYMTRTTDTGPDKMWRTYNMTAFRPDFTVCIHMNAYNNTTTGVASYYFQPFSKPFVQDIQNNLLAAYQKGKGVNWRSGSSTYAGMGADLGALCCNDRAYYSTRQTEMPSTLIECGYIDNANDYAWLTSTKGADLMTSGIRDGVLDFMKSEIPYAEKNFGTAKAYRATAVQPAERPKEPYAMLPQLRATVSN